MLNNCGEYIIDKHYSYQKFNYFRLDLMREVCSLLLKISGVNCRNGSVDNLMGKAIQAKELFPLITFLNGISNDSDSSLNI